MRTIIRVCSPTVVILSLATALAEAQDRPHADRVVFDVHLHALKGRVVSPEWWKSPGPHHPA